MCRECAEDATVECGSHRLAFLETAYLFADLDAASLGRLAAHVRDVEVPADRWLCFHGDAAASFFLVLEGEVALLRETAAGEELIVTLVGPGELFGEDLAVLDDPVHPLSARTLTPCRVAEIDRRRFRELLDREPALLLKLVQTAQRRSALLLDELESATVKSASERLLAFLERRTTGAGQPLRIPKHVLAARLAIRPETLSRILAQLKACHRLREVDGCLLPVAGDDPSAAACGACPVRLWGCPGPRAPSVASGLLAAEARPLRHRA